MVKELMTKNSLDKKLKEEKSSLISTTIHKRAGISLAELLYSKSKHLTF